MAGFVLEGVARHGSLHSKGLSMVYMMVSLCVDWPCLKFVISVHLDVGSVCVHPVKPNHIVLLEDAQPVHTQFLDGSGKPLTRDLSC